jgi:hypothetical protein
MKYLVILFAIISMVVRVIIMLVESMFGREITPKYVLYNVFLGLLFIPIFLVVYLMYVVTRYHIW